MFLFSCGEFEPGEKSGNPSLLSFPTQQTSLGKEWSDELRPEMGQLCVGSLNVHQTLSCLWIPLGILWDGGYFFSQWTNCCPPPGVVPQNITICFTEKRLELWICFLIWRVSQCGIIRIIWIIFQRLRNEHVLDGKWSSGAQGITSSYRMFSCWFDVWPVLCWK